MSLPDFPSEQPVVAGLLRLLDESGDRQCALLEQESSARIASLRRQAFAQARARVSSAIAEERLRIADAVHRVEAELHSELRRCMLGHDARLVALGHASLLAELQRRWGQAAARADWLARLLEQCARVSICRQWCLECPPDWPAEEQLAAVQLAAGEHAAELTIAPLAELQAGLRVRVGGLLVDMSIPGLLAEAATIESELLGIYQGLLEEASA